MFVSNEKEKNFVLEKRLIGRKQLGFYIFMQWISRYEVIPITTI